MMIRDDQREKGNLGHNYFDRITPKWGETSRTPPAKEFPANAQRQVLDPKESWHDWK
jgi:hypothetical protein